MRVVRLQPRFAPGDALLVAAARLVRLQPRFALGDALPAAVAAAAASRLGRGSLRGR